METSCTIIPAVMIRVPGSVSPGGYVADAEAARPPPRACTQIEIRSKVMKMMRYQLGDMGLY